MIGSVVVLCMFDLVRAFGLALVLDLLDMDGLRDSDFFMESLTIVLPDTISVSLTTGMAGSVSESLTTILTGFSSDFLIRFVVRRYGSH